MAEGIKELFSDAGLPVAPGANDRTLMASLGDEFDAIFVRAQDIPEFVADGAAEGEKLSGAVTALLDTSLSTDPAARPRDALDFLAACERLLV